MPHGRTARRRRARRGRLGRRPDAVGAGRWTTLARRLRAHLRASTRSSTRTNHREHLGTLGTGNHFIEVCLDEARPRLVHAALGLARRRQPHRRRYFIELAKQDMRPRIGNLPDRDLAYLDEGTQHFDDYVEAVDWAQHFARMNRRADDGARRRRRRALVRGCRPSGSTQEAVNCHHNYVAARAPLRRGRAS